MQKNEVFVISLDCYYNKYTFRDVLKRLYLGVLLILMRAATAVTEPLRF